MRIRRLRLHPFAGTTDREVSFDPGLNVIVGPNEAGKSTLRKALRQLLFISTKLSRREAEREVMPYLPIGGGDTLRVSAELEHDGGTWELEKRWVAGSSTCELRLPGGGVLSDHDAVQAEIDASLLVLNQGTWEHVLFAHQGEIGAHLESIGEGENIEDLNELLRRAVFETDGVSLEALDESITVRHEATFGRWDTPSQRPEGNRGLDNAWQRGAGTIVTAWYQRERARLALEEAETYYRQLDEITRRIQAIVSENESLKTWVTEHEPIAADSEKRAILEGKLAQVTGREAELKKVSQAWPTALEKKRHLDAQVAELKKKVETLSSELAQAQAWEAAGRKRRTLEQAGELRKKIETARLSLEAIPRVDPAQIQELESLEQEALRLRARLEASRLGITLRARRSLDLKTQAGIEPEQTHHVAEGETLAFEAGARATLRHADWELEVASGDIDVEAEQARFQAITEATQGLLKPIGARDLADARKRQGEFRERQQALAALEKQQNDLLKGETIATLEEAVAKAGGGEGGAPKKTTAEIAEERGQSQAEARTAEQQASETQQQVAAWKEAYGSPDSLLDRLIDLRTDRKQFDRERESLQPLPEGITDTAAFLGEFRKRKISLEERQRTHNERLVEKAQLEGQAPSIEPAEAGEQLTQADAAFDRALKEGEAINRIKKAFDSLRERMDQGTLEPWLAHLSEVLAPLTSDRYRQIDLETGSFSRDDGRPIPFDVLSMGTRACLGLAVRLSMARWFLEGRDGFLILDDPLVDLDPERQQAAAAILKHFATDKQVIVLTCHPGHAELLGGKAIAF